MLEGPISGGDLHPGLRHKWGIKRAARDADDLFVRFLVLFSRHNERKWLSPCCGHYVIFFTHAARVHCSPSARVEAITGLLAGDWDHVSSTSKRTPNRNDSMTVISRTIRNFNLQTSNNWYLLITFEEKGPDRRTNSRKFTTQFHNERTTSLYLAECGRCTCLVLNNTVFNNRLQILTNVYVLNSSRFSNFFEFRPNETCVYRQGWDFVGNILI